MGEDARIRRQADPGGAADRAGLHERDIILAVDGQPVNDEAALNYRVGTHHAGDSVALQVRSGSGAPRTLTVHAEAPPAGTGRAERVISGRNPLSGATVVNASPAVAEEVGVDPFTAQGVVVAKVGEGSAAATVGIRAGDIIRQVNGRPTANTGDLDLALAAGKGAWRITIQRGDQQITGDFTL